MKNTLKRYYDGNKEKIRESLRFKRSIRDIKIDKSILRYDAKYFTYHRNRRRGLLQSVLLGEFDIDLCWLNNDYASFVKKYNEIAKLHNISEGIFINKLDIFDGKISDDEASDDNNS